MLNKIPVLGWLLTTVGSVGLSVPFWICWTVCGIGRTYFGFVQELYQSIPFWDCVGIFIVLGILGPTFQRLVPRIVSVNNSNSNDSKS